MGPLGLAVALAVLAGDGVVPSAEGRDGLVRTSLDRLHREDFEGALAAAAELRRRWPDEPDGYLAAANVHQTVMRDYRVRVHEPEFRARLREALTIAERAVTRSPTAEHHLARASARSYQAIHRFTSGDWVRGILDAVHGVADARKALQIDPAFVDPLLATALHDFWKAEKLGLGMGLFGGGRRTVVARLERVRDEGRLLSVEAAYALQTIHYRRGDLPSALRANDWICARFPANPVGLYHRALILEGLRRDQESMDAWDALLSRLRAFPHASRGFLAECQLHRALHLARLRPGSPELYEARTDAARHAGLRVAERELEGTLTTFDDVRHAIAGLPRERAAAMTTAKR